MLRNLWQKIVDWFVQPFPDHYDPHCFECNEGPESCEGCEYRTWK